MVEVVIKYRQFIISNNKKRENIKGVKKWIDDNLENPKVPEGMTHEEAVSKLLTVKSNLEEMETMIDQKEKEMGEQFPQVKELLDIMGYFEV